LNTMRIEDVTQESLKLVSKKDLWNLKLRFQQLYNKYFDNEDSVVVGSLNRSTFLEKYQILSKEMKKKKLKLSTTSIDKALFGKLMGKYKSGAEELIDISKPYPSEHSARLQDPDMPHIRVRRTRGSGKGTVQGVKVPETISIIWYITQKDGEEIPVAQALRFPVKDWTEAEAKAWLKSNEIDYKSFEPAEEEKGVEKQLTIVSKSGDERICCGIVYEPGVPDSQDDQATAEEIKKACYYYMENSLNHFKMNHKGNPVKVSLLENYLAPNDLSIEGRAITKGTWLMTVRINDEEIWKAIKEGELTGYSMAGFAYREPSKRE